MGTTGSNIGTGGMCHATFLVPKFIILCSTLLARKLRIFLVAYPSFVYACPENVTVSALCLDVVRLNNVEKRNQVRLCVE